MPAKNRRLPEWDVLAKDFETMTPKEVATKYGVHLDHLRRVRRQQAIHPNQNAIPYEGDPRDAIKEPYRSFITDEMVAKWKETGECMCGCGTLCSVRTNRVTGPVGTRGFFTRGHQRSIAKGHIKNEQAAQQTPEARRRYAETRRAYLVDSSFLIEDLTEYLSDHDMTLEDFAKKSGLSFRTLQDYMRRKPKIVRWNAAKLLQGMDQPVPAYYNEKPDALKVRKVVIPKASNDPFAHLNHYLLHDGKVHIDYLGLVLEGRASGEVGKAKCSCGTLSPVLQSDHERKRWHRDHKTSKMSMDKAS